MKPPNGVVRRLRVKTIDGSVTIEIEIIDTFKGSLEQLRGSQLPVKDGKDMTADKVCVLA